MHEPSQQGHEPNPRKQVSSPKVINHAGFMGEDIELWKSCVILR